MQGGKRANAGRPKGSTSINQETRALFQEHTETAIQAIAEIANDKTHRDRLKACNTLLERGYGNPSATPETLGIMERFIDNEISAVQAGLLVEAHGLSVPPLLNRYIDNELKIFKTNNPVGLFEAEKKLPLN